MSAFADERDAAVSIYRRFVKEGGAAASPWLALKSQVYLGSDQFVEQVQTMIDPDRSLKEAPQRQRRPAAKPLSTFAARFGDRDRAMAAAYRSGMYSMQTIADHFGVGRMTVSRAVKREESGVTALGPSC